MSNVPFLSLFFAVAYLAATLLLLLFLLPSLLRLWFQWLSLLAVACCFSCVMAVALMAVAGALLLWLLGLWLLLLWLGHCCCGSYMAVAVALGRILLSML
jgi:hypothetical protein